MNAAELGAFVEERRCCVLATTDAAAHPVARPVAFAVLEASFWCATVAGARLRNLKRMPWASVVIEDGDGRDHRRRRRRRTRDDRGGAVARVA
jgi:nitroimidazol reductase NimA-like FMN-containing flavoprotein (pyridoxamine 5'-phosphate oxidase superfamily)